MGHVPHVYLPPPWEEPVLALPDAARHHLRRVLRRAEGAPVSYTDGEGRVGEGTLAGDAAQRGEERAEPRPTPAVTVAVAPPQRTERARYLVEKLAELGVDRLVWLSTARGAARPPRPEKARAWAVAALEQSRGAWLMSLSGPERPGGLAAPVWVADPAGGPPPPGAGALTIAVGPEGGFAPGEAPTGALAVGLGPRTLRVETAAVAAAVMALQAVGRFPTPAGTFENPAEHR